MMRGWLLDLKLAARRLWRRSLAVGVVVLSLGLATGAVTAAFSVVYGILLRPLPVEEMDQLVRLRENWGEPGGDPLLRSVNPASFRMWCGDPRLEDVFQDIAAARWLTASISTGDRPEEVRGARVSANFLPMLGVEPVIGRHFREEEARPGGDNRVVMIGHHLWQQLFGGDEGALGADLRLNGELHQVVGVLPPRFAHPYVAEVWVPLVLDESSPTTLNSTLYAPARLVPGVSPEEAERKLSQVALSLADDFPMPEAPTGADVTPLHEELLRDVDSLILPLMAGAILVLVIACANVASLLLALGLEQRREQALRVALGAGGRRESRPFVLQGLLLALAGGAVGTVFAMLSLKPLVAASPLASIAVAELGTHVGLDRPVLAVTFAVVLLLGVGLGLVPALAARRARPAEVLQEGTAGAGHGRRTRRAFTVLVAAELALAMVLLATAGLSVRSFEQIRFADRGFDVDDLLVFDVTFQDYRFPETEQRQRFTRQVVRTMEQIPGVTSAAATSVQPYWGGVYLRSFDIPSDPAPDPPGSYQVHHRMVTPGYLRTLGVPLLAGRFLNSSDQRLEDNTPVIVSRSLAERFWGVEEAVGKRIRSGRLIADGDWLTIVGVVGDLAMESSDEYLNLNDVRFTWYLPADFERAERMSIVVGTETDAEKLIPAIYDAMDRLDPEQAISSVVTMEQLDADFLGRDRFAALLGSILATVGLLLAAAGLYALVNFVVVTQRRELGIRLALGAKPAGLRRQVLRQGMAVCGAGFAVGLVAALLVARQLSHLFHAVSVTDIPTFLIVSAGLLLVALTAAWLPARRATRIQPVEVLRNP